MTRGTRDQRFYVVSNTKTDRHVLLRVITDKWGMTREECAELLAHADGKLYVCAGDDCREEQINGGVK